MSKEKAKRGRPAGKHIEKPVVIVHASKCPKCKSARRGNYYVTRSIDYGQVVDGREYSRVIWRYCKCLDCGQIRIDKELQ
jgi:hypothetical protein